MKEVGLHQGSTKLKRRMVGGEGRLMEVLSVRRISGRMDSISGIECSCIGMLRILSDCSTRDDGQDIWASQILYHKGLWCRIEE